MLSLSSRRIFLQRDHHGPLPSESLQREEDNLREIERGISQIREKKERAWCGESGGESGRGEGMLSISHRHSSMKDRQRE
jgi:hypothetical protein